MFQKFKPDKIKAAAVAEAAGKGKTARMVLVAASAIMLLLTPRSAWAMHIMEGFLPLGWALFWAGASLPFLLGGFKAVSRFFAQKPQYKMFFALAGAFVFVLSALKMPSVTGSCSHPTGVGLGAILFGPLPMTVISLIVLFFQAILLAHGGLTTLGANIFSMGVAGPLVAFALYKLGEKLALPRGASVFLAATLGNLSTYLVTSIQLALAFPMETGGVAASFLKFSGIFALTQIPLAISEGILTIIIFNFLLNYNSRELTELLRPQQKEVHSG